MRLSQMPRERRPDLEPVPPPPARRAILAPEAQPERSGTLEVDVGRVEVHVRRPPGWKRALAWGLDGIPFAALFLFALRLALDRLPHAAPLDLGAALDLAGAEASGITVPIFAGTLVLFAVYHALAHGLSGATLGKRLVGIRVVGPDGRRPGLGRAAVRAVLGAVSLLLLGMGVLLALFTRSGRALHDLLSRTWVVEAP
jgi:uncharacterized RDD family membrane protein YckC